MTIRERIARDVEAPACLCELGGEPCAACLAVAARVCERFAAWLDERAKGHDRAITEFRRQGRAMAAVDSVSQMTECRDIAAELRGGGK